MPVSVNILFGKVWVTLDDQRVIGLPLDAFPWLEHATPEQQRNYEASPISIYWPDLENGIDMEYFTGEWALDRIPDAITPSPTPALQSLSTG